jgi:hypothetical protein
MAKLSPEIEKILKQLKALKSKLSDVEKNQLDSIVESFKKGGKSLDEWNEQLESFRDKADSTSSSLSYIADALTDSVNELQKQNKYLSQSKTVSNQILKSAQDALSVRKGETSINEKSLKSAKERIESQKRILKNSQLNLGVFSKEGLEIKSIIDNLEEYENGLDGVLKTNEEINKKLGFAPQLASGLDKALQKAGVPSLGIADALDKVKKNGQAAAAAGGKIGKDFKPAKEFTKQIGSNLKDAFSKANLLQGAIVGLVKAFGTSQKGIGDLAKGLGMSASRATVMRQEFADIANTSMNANLTVKDLQETTLAVGQALGTNAKLNEKDLNTMTDLVKKTGLQHSELIGIEKLSLATGKSLDDNVEAALGGATAFASQNKLVVDNNKVLREVNKASDALKLSLGGSVEALGEAVVKAQKFGINLEQAERISSSMLDFESSIEAELSAELLTGKNLNLERARQLALEGDIAEAAGEVLKQLEGSEEFNKMNVIQQEAMAKAVGLTREQLASSLIEREALEKMSAKEGESALQAYERLKAQGKTQAEIVKILGEETAEKLEQQSAQEKFNNSVEKLKEIFVQVMDALAPVFDVFSSIAEVVLPAINFLLTPFINGIKWISKYAEDILIIFGSIYAVQKLMTVTEGILLTIQASKVASKTTELGLGGALLANLGFQNAAEMYKLTLMTGGNTLAAIRAGIEETILGSIIAQGFGILKNIGRLAIENAARLIGMSTALATNAAVTFGVGVAIAVAAAAAGYAAIKALTADDMLSPGQGSSGYGKRTLFGPEGAIQLNDKDTVIAGTNLFGNDVKSEPGKATEMAGKGEIKVKSDGGGKVDMTQTNALLQQLINVIQTGGIVELDGQKVGTALKLGSFQTQ